MESIYNIYVSLQLYVAIVLVPKYNYLWYKYALNK